jgi:hypothetical protein
MSSHDCGLDRREEDDEKNSTYHDQCRQVEHRVHKVLLVCD